MAGLDETLGDTRSTPLLVGGAVAMIIGVFLMGIGLLSVAVDLLGGIVSGVPEVLLAATIVGLVLVAAIAGATGLLFDVWRDQLTLAGVGIAVGGLLLLWAIAPFGLGQGLGVWVVPALAVYSVGLCTLFVGFLHAAVASGGTPSVAWQRRRTVSRASVADGGERGLRFLLDDDDDERERL